MADHKPLYRWSLQDAVTHNEVQDWRDSYRENCDCARAIERAIADQYHDNILENGTKDIIDRYGFDRVNWVLANTLQEKAHDGRFSQDNKRWAKGFFIPSDDVRWHFCVESHPGLTDLFINQTREAWQKLGLFDASHCSEDNDYAGKLLILKPSVLKDEFKASVARARKNYEDSQKSKETIEKEISVQESMMDFFSGIELGVDTFKTINGNEFTITSVDDKHVNISIPGMLMPRF